jgi:hypothetical protein
MIHGGAIESGMPIDFANSTIVNNSSPQGGGLVMSQLARFKNSIVANNSGGNCAGANQSFGNNLSSDQSCNFGAKGDLTGINPMIGPPTMTAGVRLTHILRPGSPGIDAGNEGGCTDFSGGPLAFDQLGMPRHQDGNGDAEAACDMGALESPSPSSTQLRVASQLYRKSNAPR